MFLLIVKVVWLVVSPAFTEKYGVPKLILYNIHYFKMFKKISAFYFFYFFAKKTALYY